MYFLTGMFAAGLDWVIACLAKAYRNLPEDGVSAHVVKSLPGGDLTFPTNEPRQLHEL